MPLMTKKAYAAHRGCKPAYISKKDVSARLTDAMVQENGSWLIDSEKADAILNATRDPAADLGRETPVKVEDKGSYTAVRTAKESVKLEIESLELAERKKQTLPRGATYQAAAAVGQTLRESLNSRNRSLAEQLSTMKETREILILLEASDRNILEQLSSDFLRKLQSAGGGADS